MLRSTWGAVGRSPPPLPRLPNPIALGLGCRARIQRVYQLRTIQSASKAKVSDRSSVAPLIAGLAIAIGAHATYFAYSSTSQIRLDSGQNESNPANSVLLASNGLRAWQPTEPARLLEERNTTLLLPRPQLTLDQLPNLATAEGITAVLRQQEYSIIVKGNKGPHRFDFSQVPSNSICEDDHDEKLVAGPSADGVGIGREWMFWGIYDGH